MMKAKVAWAILAIIVITATAATVSNRVFSPHEAGDLVITQVEIPGRFGIVGLSGTGPANPKVSYTPVGGQEIVLTFSESLEPGQNLALMYLQMGHPVGIGGQRAEIDDYYIEGNRLVIIARRGGIPTQFVSLFIPAGVRSAMGTVMGESVHMFFSTSALGPHQLWNLISLIPSETGQHPSLVIPRRWGDERGVMYANTHTELRDAYGKVIRIIHAGENAHLLTNDGSKSLVRLYRQGSSPFAEGIDAHTDIYSSHFIQAEEGYVASADLSEVPLPLNPYCYVMVTLSNVHHPDEHQTAMIVGSQVSQGFSVPIRSDSPLLDTLVAPMAVYPMFLRGIMIAGESYRGFEPFVDWSADYYIAYLLHREAYDDFVMGTFVPTSMSLELDDLLNEAGRSYQFRAALQDSWIKWGVLYGGTDVLDLIYLLKEALPDQCEAIDLHFSPLLEDPSRLEECFMSMWNEHILPLFSPKLDSLRDQIYQHPSVIR